MGESKPWEETWTWEPDSDAVICETDDYGRFDGDRARAKERARLAASAPDMARVLLAIEWSNEVGGHYAVCPSCDACKSSLCEHSPEPHQADCALDAALRKAGVQ